MSKIYDFPCIFTSNCNITYVCSISLVNRYSKNRYCKKCQICHDSDFQNQISHRFIYGFSNFLMLRKEEYHVFQLNSMYIYEIFPKPPAKVLLIIFNGFCPGEPILRKSLTCPSPHPWICRVECGDAALRYPQRPLLPDKKP